MNLKSLWRPLRLGLGSGLFGALILIVVSLILRWAVGTGTLPELLGDRIAPLLGLHLFFFLIGFMRSYRLLKEVGILSMVANEFAAGVFFGLLLVWLQHRAPAKARTRFIAAIFAVFALVTAFIWGNLRTNYLGLPPSSARSASVAALALSAVLFTVAILWANRQLNSANDLRTQPTDTRRRAIFVGAGSFALALFNVAAFAGFYRIASYGYDGNVNEGDDLPPVTPNDAFYSVTKNNVDPDPTLKVWALEVYGKVQKPLKLHLSDLRGMTQITQQATLQCISNPIGGTLSSNGVWTGVPLTELLARCGASDRTKQVMLHGADGFVDAIPIEAARHPYTLVVHQMNGVDIPQIHGYPVRLIVPGYVGEKSVKWLTGIEVREVPGEGFYEEQGWGPHFAIENDSRFDAPGSGSDVKVGDKVELKGTAFCGDRGVRAVQVSTDDGDTWSTAQLTYPGTKLTWAQWSYTFIPRKAGDINLSVRSVDGLGAIQSDDKHGPGPGQSSGLHQISLTANA